MTPHVRPLARSNRNFIFGLLVFIFLVALPAFIFYATGYRFDMFSASPTITVTGGLYVVAGVDAAEVFVNEEPIRNAREFSNATFASGIVPGTHRVHVQSLGRHTWVKNMQVYPQFVTEAESFNMPLVPQIRLLSQYETATGTAVVASSTLAMFGTASITNPVLVAKIATSTLEASTLYASVQELFARQASTTHALVVEESPFLFATTTATATVPQATTTVTRNGITLYERAGSVYARALPENRSTPYYFCTIEMTKNEATTTVVTTLSLALPDTYADIKKNLATCDREIKIDQLGQTVRSFNFLPDTNNLVLLTLENGVYVVEIDDRFWQNAQPLFLGTDLESLLDGNNIYIKRGEVIFEVFTDFVS